MLKRNRLLIGSMIVVAAAAATTCTVDGADPTGPASGGDFVAQVGSNKITLEMVDERAKATNMQAYQQLYDVRRLALDELINDELLAVEAKARGVTKEQLVEKEITAKAKPVTDEDIETFHNENKARMRNQPLAQVKAQIRSYLEEGNRRELQQALLEQAKKKASVRITLDAPRTKVKIAANDPTQGPADAAIQIVVFSEFQ